MIEVEQNGQIDWDRLASCVRCLIPRTCSKLFSRKKHLKKHINSIHTAQSAPWNSISKTIWRASMAKGTRIVSICAANLSYPKIRIKWALRIRPIAFCAFKAYSVRRTPHKNAIWIRKLTVLLSNPQSVPRNSISIVLQSLMMTTDWDGSLIQSAAQRGSTNENTRFSYLFYIQIYFPILIFIKTK